MPRKAAAEPVNHLRAWREYRGLTQGELAELVGTAGNVISQIESGKTGLSDKWLRKLAPALKTTPGRLLDFDPNDVDSAFVDAALQVPKNRRAQALVILQSFRTGTDD